MIEAAKTTASAGEIWAIVIVAVLCLAFWLGIVAWADMHPVWRRHQLPDMQGSVLGGIHLAAGGRSVAPDRTEAAIETEERRGAPIESDMVAEPAMTPAAAGQPAGAYGTGAATGPALPAQRRGAADQSQPAGAAPDVPGQRAGESDRPQPAGTQTGGMPDMPAQRSGEGDKPEQSASGGGGTDRRGQ